MKERTLSILKPDAVRRNITGKINSIFEENGLKIVGQKMILLTRWAAKRFYMEHREKPFYNDLVEMMTSGPVIVQILEGDNAILKNRELMGKTNPKEAADGTIRKMFGISIEENTVHGSDSVISVQREINFFFSDTEIFEPEEFLSKQQ